MFDYQGYEITVEPAVEPVDFAEFSDFARDIPGADQSLVMTMLFAAREQIEAMINRAMINRTVKVYWDEWPSKRQDLRRALFLPFAPATSITSVQYIDGNGALQTWATVNYVTDITSEPPRITLAYGASFPTARSMANAITVTYVAGYGATKAAVPRALRLAVMAAALDMYERRDMNTPEQVRENPAIRNLLASYRIHTVK